MHVTGADAEVVVRGASSAVQDDLCQSLTSRTDSSPSNPFVKAGFVQVSLETSVLVWMRSEDSEGLPKRLGHNNVRNSIFSS